MKAYNSTKIYALFINMSIQNPTQANPPYNFKHKLTWQIFGIKSTTAQNQIMTKYTAVVSNITLEPKTSDTATSLDTDSYCGPTGWSSGAKASIAGLTCGSITYKAQNAEYSDLIQVSSEKTFIRLGNTTNLGSNGYPKTLYKEEYYK